MKKTKQFHTRGDRLTSDQIARFLEDFRKTAAGVDQKTVAISIRIPKNILNAVKAHAKQKNTKYQPLIIQWIRDGILKD
jgi:predicted DNA binding CopG/RHH family protein